MSKFTTVTVAIDGAKTSRKYTTLEAATKRLVAMVGEHAERDSLGWFIASDGVVKAKIIDDSGNRVAPLSASTPKGGRVDVAQQANPDTNEPEILEVVDENNELVDVVFNDPIDDGEAEASIALPRSVVKPTFKLKYIERANAMARKPKGVPMKALKRMTGDWLAIELAKLTLDPKAKLIVSQFEAVLDANGIDHSHWNRTTKGWQGRLRMTGRLALQRVVAAEGVLHVPGGADIPAPRNWVAANTH